MLNIEIKTEWPAFKFSESQRPATCQDIPSNLKDKLLLLVPPSTSGRSDACWQFWILEIVYHTLVSFSDLFIE